MISSCVPMAPRAECTARKIVWARLCVGITTLTPIPSDWLAMWGGVLTILGIDFNMSVYRSQTCIETGAILCRREGWKSALELSPRYGHVARRAPLAAVLRRWRNSNFCFAATNSFGGSCLEYQHFRCDRVLHLSFAPSRWPLHETYKSSAVQHEIHRHERPGGEHILLHGNRRRRQLSGEQFLQRSGGDSSVSVV
jgi:hypothetical protein